jgi:hypothetical protein
MQNNFYAIIPHHTGESILVLPAGGAWTIPVYHPKSSWTPYVQHIIDVVKAQFGFQPAVRYTPHVHVERVEDKRYAFAIYVMVAPPSDWAPPEGACWVTLEEFRALSLSDDWPRPHVDAYFAEEQSGTVPHLRPPWGRKGWYNDISGWAECELAKHNLSLLAPLQQMKQWDISSVLKGRTEGGDVYVKAIPTLFATEPRITAGLARIFPGIVPDPLAIYERSGEGRLLLHDFGGKLLWDEGVEWTAMEEALRLLARMQIECAGRTSDLLAIGCRDRRIQGLTGDLRSLLADSRARARLTEAEVERLQAILPTIERACAHLLSAPVPQTLLHGDFHGGNVALTEAGYVIFDWTDACVCHPFFDLLTIVDNEYEPIAEEKRERYLSVYLGEWEAAGYGSSQSLHEICDLALKIGPLYHAVSYWHIDRHGEQAMQAELGNSMAYFLRLSLSRLETKQEITK